MEELTVWFQLLSTPWGVWKSPKEKNPSFIMVYRYFLVALMVLKATIHCSFCTWGSVTVQYLLSGHVRIKPICTIRSPELAAFILQGAGPCHRVVGPGSLVTKTNRGLQLCHPGSLWAEAAGVAAQGAGVCLHFRKNRVKPSFRNPAQAALEK